MRADIFLLLAMVNLAHLSAKAQESKQKDTLFFKYDKNYINVYDVTPGKFYLKDSGGDETFFFKELETSYNLKPQKTRCLKKFIRSSKFYNKKRTRKKLNDYRLSEYLENYIIFLVKKEGDMKKYIKVYPLTEIE